MGTPSKWNQLTGQEQDVMRNWILRNAITYGYYDGEAFDPADPETLDGLWRTVLQMQDVVVNDEILFAADRDEELLNDQLECRAKVLHLHKIPCLPDWTEGFSLDTPLLGCGVSGVNRYVDFREFAGKAVLSQYAGGV